jgi:hypothetical protein
VTSVLAVPVLVMAGIARGAAGSGRPNPGSARLRSWHAQNRGA